MEIRPLNLDDDQSMADAYLIECAANQHVRSGWTPPGQGSRILGWRASDGWRNHLVGAWDGSTLVGFAAGMNASATPETTWVFVWVAPERQKAGLGTALVRKAEDTSLESTTRFISSSYRATVDDMETLIRHFAGPLGYAVATTETVVELDLRETQLLGPQALEGYDISTHINGVPEQYRKQVGQIKGLVDSEAPNGDLDWAETPVSPVEYAREIELWVAQGHSVLESIAVDPQGNVAAWTCLLAGSDDHRTAHIEGTLVVATHRGRSLGMAIKRACLQQARPFNTVHKVRTSSDDENVWMRSINTALGFLPVEHEVIFQKDRPRD